MIDGTFAVEGAAGPIAFFSNQRPESLSHGYLFSGPAGAGKKTFALRLAQSLLCVTPKATLLGYCGTCSGCTRVVAGVHPDLYVVEGQVKIGDPGGSGFHEDEATARDIVRQLSMHSYAGGKRIVILGDADFTREAANALLKFFEEPAGDVIVIVTSSTPGRLLATIRSRLIEVLFAARPETTSVDPEAGALRDAAAEWFLAAARGAETDASWATRPTLEDGLTTIKTLARDWLALAVAGDAAPLLARDRTADVRALPPRDPVALVRTLASIGDAERIARTNVTPALVAELVRMALAPSR